MPGPPIEIGGPGLNVCSAVSYFSTRVGSIIGAGRLSFRVRDGTGRFPAAMDRRNFIHPFLGVNLWVCFGGGVWCAPVATRGSWGCVVWLRSKVVRVLRNPNTLVFVGCCKFSAG